MWWILSFLLGFLIWWWRVSKKRPEGFPPGPNGVPIFGNAFQLGKYSFKAAMYFQRQYGDIIGFRVGSYWAVFLNNVDDVKEAFNRPEFMGRTGFNSFLDQNCCDVNYGLIFSYGQQWSDRRRFSLRTLRDFGFGKRSAETIIMEEFRELLQRLQKLEGQTICTKELFNPAVFNVLWTIVAGQRYPHDDPRTRELMQMILAYFSEVLSLKRALMVLFPFAVDVKDRFPSLLVKHTTNMREKMFTFFRKIVSEHRATLQQESPRDFIDAYIIESETKGDNRTEDDMNLIVTLMDLFIAGSETTSTTLIWTFFLFALHPHIQDQVHQEIHEVVGTREVSLADKQNLPYSEATIMEIMRVSTLAPLGTLHSTTEDVIFKGYRIPRDTIIVPNIYAAHFSPKYWEDPHNFRPERFLSENRKTIIRPKAYMPFGTGRRSCLGESLAKDEFFLFFTNIAQNVRVTFPEEAPSYKLDPIFKAVLIPEPHKVIITIRN